MRKRVKKNEEVALTSMGIAKHDFLGRSLKRLKLILRLSTQHQKRRKVDKYIDSNSDLFAKM